MILYRPSDGDVQSAPVQWRPKTAFIMAQLGGEIPQKVSDARREVDVALKAHGFNSIDADSVTTGKDFLNKIWQLVLSVPLGVAVVHEGIPPQTLANIFFELGWLQAYGKEAIIIRIGNVPIPSDFVRTEYIKYDGHFDRRFNAFLENVSQQSDYYRTLADQVENNPLLAIDYLRRAYLICGDEDCRSRAKAAFDAAGFTGRAKNSVETLLVRF